MFYKRADIKLTTLRLKFGVLISIKPITNLATTITKIQHTSTPEC